MNAPDDPSGSSCYRQVFAEAPAVSTTALSRVDILGGHTDYNQGFVLAAPMPLTTSVELSLKENLGDATGNHIEIEGYSTLTGDKAVHRIPATSDSASRHRRGDWIDYVVGAARELQSAGADVSSFRLAASGNVPTGAGLASSASFSVALLRGLGKLFEHSLEGESLAKTAQRIERIHVGVNCGIMDPLILVDGTVGNALFIDTLTLAREAIAIDPDYRLEVIDCGERRRLADVGYNLRRDECQRAAQTLGVNSLRELDGDEPDLKDLPPPLDRRVRHVLSENLRVIEARNALKSGNYAALGRLMHASHLSLRDDYEVSVPALDRLVEDCLTAGALGARLAGAGFGGCVVALIESAQRDTWRRRIATMNTRACVFDSC
ncbi:galactokinase [Denitrobaculum tricleocarpae]|uniref:Galactokinase n=1 Tax=Denitrobaculum tricleocarpae TaxID=2591009 RepID=A0A545TUI8_9PROT|nr:galactokinase family protein [Denitrobaculum tricleocarpae]TQV80885.1 galactokinase [Denitrobaculum tricleocarpae]